MSPLVAVVTLASRDIGQAACGFLASYPSAGITGEGVNVTVGVVTY